MSTMYDALKKAEAGRKSEHIPSSGQGSAPSSVTGSVVVILAVILAGILGWNFTKARAASANQQALAAQKAVTLRNKAEKPKAAVAGPAGAHAAKPAADRYPPGTYTLEGVIDSGVDSIAVINGKLLKVGETIDDLAVRKVSAREVELFKAGDNSRMLLELRP